MNDYLVQVQNIQKSYGDHQVLKGIDLGIRQGEFLTLLGPSGCGKTTLLRILGGFETADEGKILLDGEDITGLSPNERNVNTVFQSYALFPHLDVFENVAFGLKLKKMKAPEMEERVMNALKMVHLEHLADRMPSKLSGGQQQRIAIARAVVNQPRVLLLDESLSALDYKLRKSMQVELKNLQRELGISFVFVTHDQEEALSMSDRIVVLNEGRIEQLGSASQIYEDPASLFVAQFIGETTIFQARVVEVQERNLKLSVLNQIIPASYEGVASVGEDFHLVVRPEDLRVEREAASLESEFHFEGVIENVIYRGTVIDLKIRIEDLGLIQATEFYNEDSDALEYEVGLNVYISWVKGWEVLLPHESQI